MHMAEKAEGVAAREIFRQTFTHAYSCSGRCCILRSLVGVPMKRGSAKSSADRGKSGSRWHRVHDLAFTFDRVRATCKSGEGDSAPSGGAPGG